MNKSKVFRNSNSGKPHNSNDITESPKTNNTNLFEVVRDVDTKTDNNTRLNRSERRYLMYQANKTTSANSEQSTSNGVHGNNNISLPNDSGNPTTMEEGRAKPKRPFHRRKVIIKRNLEAEDTDTESTEEIVYTNDCSTWPEKITYPFTEITLETIYPEDKMDVIKDLTSKHSVQQRLGRIWYCLLCDVNHVSFRNLKSHLESEKHSQRCKQTNKMTGLEFYNTFWESQPEELRKYQIRFNLCTGSKIKCAKCKRKIIGETWIEHLVQWCVSKKENRFRRRLAKSGKQNAVRGRNDNQQDKQLEGEGNSRQGELAKENLPENQVDKSETGNNNAETNQKVRDMKRSRFGRSRNNKTSDFHDVKHLPKEASTIWSSIVAGMPQRYDSHFPYFKIENVLQCTACETPVEQDVVSILLHITRISHCEKAGIPKNRRIFACGICTFKCNSEAQFWIHLNRTPSHVENLKKMAAVRQDDMKEVECFSCNLISFGDDLLIAKHKKTLRNVSDKQQSVVHMDPEFVRLFSTKESMENLAKELLNKAAEVEKLQFQVTAVVNDLETSLREVYPAAKAHPFGSRMTGLCNKSSDLDVYVDVVQNYYGKRVMAKNEVLKRVQAALKTADRIWDDMFAISGARTPIIQIKHVPTGLDLDISFQHGLSIENTKFTKLCLKLQPLLQPACLILKMWCAKNHFKEFLSTYALCMMLIFVMQVDGHLIPVAYLKEINRHRNESNSDGDGDGDGDSPADCDKDNPQINGWDIINYRLTAEDLQKYVEPINGTVLDVLYRFFDYYAKFDFAKMLICPLLGVPIDMSDWLPNNVHVLPPEMSTYVEKVYEGEIRHLLLSGNYYMTVQDPFDLSHVLTKAIGKKFVADLQANCKYMTELLGKLQ